MNQQDESQAHRLAALVRTSINELDEDSPFSSQTLSRRALHSRSQFFRLFRALIEETPGGMRRLLLERAAWQLSRTPNSVTEIAFNADYGSLEAFTRAFRKAYRISPSLYRRMGTREFRLPSPNGFHFNQPSKGKLAMDLFDIFDGHDSWHTRQLLEHAASLNDEQLDRPLASGIKVFPWDTPDQSLRDLLERLVYTKEVWVAALNAETMPELEKRPAEQRTPCALLERFAKVESNFHGLLERVRNRGAWDDTFIDALCEPPETFTFGGMFAHVITFNSYRRLTAMDAMRNLGVEIKGFGCPSEFEATLAK